MVKPARFLSIETSSPRLSLAVGTDTSILKDYHGPLAWRHAETLMDGMQTLLRQVRWPVQSLTGVAVSIGPGSFTGIRIGLAAARGLGQALAIPVVGISSLAAIAHAHLKPGVYACPVVDALRGEVFTGLYQMNESGHVRTIWKEQRMTLAELLRKLKSFSHQPLRLAGDAVILHKEALGRLGGKHWRWVTAAEGYPDAGQILKLARPRLLKGKASFETVIPLYLRSAAAIERQKR